MLPADPTFIKNFLMTFKSFMTLDELFELLVQRFWIQAPESLSPQELEEWTKQKQVMIRLRSAALPVFVSRCQFLSLVTASDKERQRCGRA